MLQLLLNMLLALKDFSPLPLAIIGLIVLGGGQYYQNVQTLTVVQGNTAAITKMVFMAERQNINEQSIMRRLDLIENYVRRK
jgi:hypothetical protein